jgi:Methyltransferase domain
MRFAKLAVRYTGPRAKNYDPDRERGPKWSREQQIVEGILAAMPAGSSVIDVPVGTGRFLGAYSRQQMSVTGVDVSPDMLREARTEMHQHGMLVDLRQADIRALPVGNRSFDLAVCIRFLNWIDINGVGLALAELARVSRGEIIVGLRHFTPLRELRGLARFGRQLVLRARKRRDRDGLVFHEKEQLHRAFRRNGLEIAEKILVEERSDGTDYFIYRLRGRKSA